MQFWFVALLGVFRQGVRSIMVLWK
jgi:hypothetical protein